MILCRSYSDLMPIFFRSYYDLIMSYYDLIMSYSDLIIILFKSYYDLIMLCSRGEIGPQLFPLTRLVAFWNHSKYGCLGVCLTYYGTTTRPSSASFVRYMCTTSWLSNADFMILIPGGQLPGVFNCRYGAIGGTKQFFLATTRLKSGARAS